MLVFAYDGSLNGDWVAHYAARFAANTPDRRLRLAHVYEGTPAEHLEGRIARIAEECRVLGVELETELLPRGAGRVADRLVERVPAGAMLVAGTRARPRGFEFLAGTVSARLFELGRCPVIAVRVVHPGVLGQPGRVLLPLAGRTGSASSARTILDLLGGDLRHLHLLFVRELSRLRFRALGAAGAERFLSEGRAYLAQVEAELGGLAEAERFDLDASAVVSDDAPKEILLHAARARARLICLGASERTLPERLVYGNPIEQILRSTPADVAIYRSLP